MDVNAMLATASTIAVRVGLQILGAIVVWMVGRWLIHLAIRMVTRSLEIQKVDPTLNGYVASTLHVLLNVALVVAILGYFGVETTTFAALIAAAGVAIGVAWSGLLANFAAGAFLIVLRPIKMGDFVSAAGVTGTVREVGLFVTTIVSPDNVVNFVGNNKIFADNVQNYSLNPHRRVELTAQLAHGVDPLDAIRRLKERLAAIPNVTKDPVPDVEILTFTPMGPVLAVRPHTHTDHYWQVYFDTNKAIVETFGAAGYPVPEQHYRVQRSA